MTAERPSRMGEWLRRLGVLTDPLFRPLAGRRTLPLHAVVHSRGRRSGQCYAVPVAIRPTADGFVIPVAFGGEQWFRNVLATGECTIHWKGADHPAIEPRIVARPEVADRFNLLQRAVVHVTGIDTFLRLRRPPDR